MVRIIPYFLVCVLVLLYVAELRAEGPVIDPAIAPSKTLVYDMPVTRADLLAAGAGRHRIDQFSPLR